MIQEGACGLREQSKSCAGALLAFCVNQGISASFLSSIFLTAKFFPCLFLLLSIIYLLITNAVLPRESLDPTGARPQHTCNVGDMDLIPGLGRSPGEGNGNPLQYSCLVNSMDRGTWWATVHGAYYQTIITIKSVQLLKSVETTHYCKYMLIFSLNFTTGCFLKNYITRGLGKKPLYS